MTVHFAFFCGKVVDMDYFILIRNLFLFIFSCAMTRQNLLDNSVFKGNCNYGKISHQYKEIE